MPHETVRIAMEGSMAVLSMHRPEALNALNAQLRKDLAAALDELNRDAGVKGIVLRGSGERSFCAGVDLKEAQSVRVEEVESWFGEVRDIYHAIRMTDKPVVAALNGVATGAGFQMALVSDLRVGHPGTRMGQPEINAGIPSIMGSFWMSLHIGLSLNQDLSFTGRLLDAGECQSIGLLNHLVETPQLLPKALEVAAELAAKPPTAFRRTKQRFRELTQNAFDEAFRSAVEGQKECYANGEPQEVMARFIAERSRRKKG